jgi:hypothetical protein
MEITSRRSLGTRQLAKIHARVFFLFVLIAVAPAAMAYPGQGLLEFFASYFLAPAGLFAFIIICTAAIGGRPEALRMAAFGLLICVFLYGVIEAAPTIISRISQH